MVSQIQFSFCQMLSDNIKSKLNQFASNKIFESYFVLLVVGCPIATVAVVFGLLLAISFAVNIATIIILIRSRSLTKAGKEISAISTFYCSLFAV